MSKLCVSKLCVDKLEEEAAGGGGGGEGGGIQNQKQEPHTKMWGKKEGKAVPNRNSGPCIITNIHVSDLTVSNLAPVLSVAELLKHCRNKCSTMKRCIHRLTSSVDHLVVHVFDLMLNLMTSN